MIITIYKPRFRSRLAIFDFDWTLVKPKSGGTFPKDVDDWIWLRPNVPQIVKSYYEKGFGIMVATNQSKIWKIQQIKNAMSSLEIPLTIGIANLKEEYKPSVAIFHAAFDSAKRKKINVMKSFLCGDAMGRSSDHSDSDLVFAKNIGIQCLSPEIIFPFVKTVNNKNTICFSKKHEVVIMMGYPASGKSTLAKNVFGDAILYSILHGDELKTLTKMIKAAESEIKNGKSVVFDATHPSKAKRKVIVKMAKTHHLTVRCIHVQTSMEEAMMRNNLRENPIPKMAFYLYRKHFEEPNEVEEEFTVFTVCGTLKT